MKKAWGLLLLLLAWTNTQPSAAENQFGVTDELFAYWYTGVQHMPDSVTVQVADSLLRLADQENDDKIRMMGENLTYIIYYYKFDEENFSVHVNRCKELCKKLGNHHMYVTTVNNIIGFYSTIGKSEKSMTEARDLLEEGKKTGDAETLLYAYSSLSGLCYASGQYQECITMSHLCLGLHEQNPDIPIDPLITYRYLAQSYQALSQIDSCEYYLHICEQKDPNFAEAPYIRALNDWSLHEDKQYFDKQYEKIMSMGPSVLHTESVYRQQMQMMKYAIEGDIEKAKAIGIPEGMSRRNAITVLAEIYSYAKEYKLANKTYKQLAIVTDSIQNADVRELQNKFRMEMETVYETKEKEEQIMRQTYTLIICGVGLIALIIVVFLMLKRNRDMKQKNLALTARINEMLDVKQQQMQQQQAEPAPEIPEPENIDEEDEMQLHRQVERVIYEIVKRQLFTNPDFKRDDLLEELHINKRTFARDFEATTGQNFARYILGLRMDFAAQLIREHPDYSNDAVAQMSGIPSRSSFYRNFSEYFGLSPIAYRDGLKA